jgi:hypothetical protein
MRPAVAQHVESRAAHEMPRGAGWDELREMVEVNTREGLGPGWLPALTYLDQYGSAFEDAPCCAIDGRMQHHEWLRTKYDFVKTDHCDHHADHFFPGPQNVAWDVAGAAIELGIDLPGIALPFYRTAYAAFRLGYVTMAAGALGGSPDGRRFARASARYNAILRALLASRGERWHGG